MRNVLILLILHSQLLFSVVHPGIDQLMGGGYDPLLHHRRVGLITNHTAIDTQGRHTINRLKKAAEQKQFRLVALFAPEHGINGSTQAEKAIQDSHHTSGIPVYSLYGQGGRPSVEALQKVDLLVYDIQDIGCRTYTFATTLFQLMEAAAKANIPVIVLDRPNPLGGMLIDGPVLEPSLRSAVGYIGVPSVHGMTIGELALFFNREYGIGCKLTVVPLRGWKRSMHFSETDLSWIPTSPNIPTSKTPFYFATTGLLGELGLVSIGMGSTLPFQVVGAPWIDAEEFAVALNKQRFPGVRFHPFHFSPQFGRNARVECHGVLIDITDPKAYRPIRTQYLLLGVIKSLYPRHFAKMCERKPHQIELFHKVAGSRSVWQTTTSARFIVWPLIHGMEPSLQQFAKKRERYLLY